MGDNRLEPLRLSEDERRRLENWVKRRNTAQGLALRARIVLACARGGSTWRSRRSWVSLAIRSPSGGRGSCVAGWTGYRTSRAPSGARHWTRSTRSTADGRHWPWTCPATPGLPAGRPTTSTASCTGYTRLSRKPSCARPYWSGTPIRPSWRASTPRRSRLPCSRHTIEGRIMSNRCRADRLVCRPDRRTERRLTARGTRRVLGHRV